MGLLRCPEGHMFSSRRYGSICPYCHKAVRLSHDNAIDDAEGIYNDATPYIGDLEVLDPVTGWLVCIDGPSKGRDYKVFTAKNFIGRADSMDIQILGDNSISKKNHAIVIYDPKTRKTVIMPGDSKGLVYVNDDIIYSHKNLDSNDIIELGKSRFIFISLCGENFEWKDIKDVNKNKKQENKKQEKKEPEEVEGDL